MTYNVFVSSTYLDNVDRRRIVYEAIQAAGMLPIGMERFAAGTDPAVDECVRMAGEADLLVGIIAWRYGWIPEGGEVSITELEYNAAKERLMFLPDDTMRVTSPDDADQGKGHRKKQKKLDAFKARLAKDQMPGRFNDDNLGVVVLQSLTEWKEKHRIEQSGSPAFEQLRIGDLEDRVGRDDELNWLKEHLIDRDTMSVALTSLTGTGGMGKTFLAQVFANQYKKHHRFLPIYLGDTKPFDAGVQMLTNIGIPTAEIDGEEKLKAAMHRFYAKGRGIVVLDDVRSEDARLLMPKTTNWRVLLTMRDQALAKKLCGQKQVRELKVLTPEEAEALYRKVLEEQYDEDLAEDYQALTEYVAYRPYAVRLAAGFLREAPDYTPRKLLTRIEKGEAPVVYDPYSFENLERLLSHCLDQLQSANPMSRSLLNALAVCADQGMDMDHFVEWQSTDNTPDQVEQAIRRAHAFGLMLLETTRDAGEVTNNLRLHTDVHRHLRRGELLDQGRSLSGYLKRVLVERKDGRRVEPELQVHIWSLFLQFGGVEDFFESILDDFGEHLWRTGRRSWAMDLLKKDEALCIELCNKNGLSASYSNQAAILSDWGRLEEAMVLHKKEEALCIELGDKDGLQLCYGNQAHILQAWNRHAEADALLEKQRMIKKQIR